MSDIYRPVRPRRSSSDEPVAYGPTKVYDSNADKIAADAARGEAQRLNREQAFAERQAREAERASQAAALAATKQSNYEIDTVAAREGRKTVTDPTGRRQYLETDEEWEAKKQAEAAEAERKAAQAKANDEAALAYKREGRQYHTGSDGVVRPVVPDEEWEAKKKARAAEAERKGAVETAEALYRVEGPTRPILTEKDREERERKSASLLEDAIFNATRQKGATKEQVARLKAIMSAADAAGTRVRPEMVPEDLAQLVEQANPDAWAAGRAGYDELAQDAENFLWHEERKREIDIAKLRATNPKAYRDYLRRQGEGGTEAEGAPSMEEATAPAGDLPATNAPAEAKPVGGAPAKTSAEAAGEPPAPAPKPAAEPTPAPGAWKWRTPPALENDEADPIEGYRAASGEYGARVKIFNGDVGLIDARWNGVLAQIDALAVMGGGIDDFVPMTIGEEEKLVHKTLMPQVEQLNADTKSSAPKLEAEGKELARAKADLEKLHEKARVVEHSRLVERQAAVNEWLDGLDADKDFAPVASRYRAVEATFNQRYGDLARDNSLSDEERGIAMRALQDDHEGRVAELNADLQQVNEAKRRKFEGVRALGDLLVDDPDFADTIPGWSTMTEKTKAALFERRREKEKAVAAAYGLTDTEASRAMRSYRESAASFMPKEKARVLSDGRVQVNPALLWDDAAYAKAVAEAGTAKDPWLAEMAAAPPRKGAANQDRWTAEDLAAKVPEVSDEARKQALDDLPRLRQAAAPLLIAGYRNLPGFDAFERRQAEMPRDKRPRNEAELIQRWNEQRGGAASFLDNSYLVVKQGVNDAMAQVLASGGAIGYGFNETFIRPVLPVTGERNADAFREAAEDFIGPDGAFNAENSRIQAVLDREGVPVLAQAIGRAAPSVAVSLVGGAIGAGTKGVTSAILTRGSGLGAITGKSSLDIAGRALLGDMTRGFARITPKMAKEMSRNAGMGGAGAGAFFQTFGSVYPEAVRSYMEEGRTFDEAMGEALLPAAGAGVFTAAITMAFGRTGIEALVPGGDPAKATVGDLVKLLSKPGNRAKWLATMRSPEFRKTAGEIVGRLADGTIKEMPEEGLDELFTGLIGLGLYENDPDRSVGDAIHDGLVGAIVGAALGAGGEVAAIAKGDAAKALGGLADRLGGAPQATQAPPAPGGAPTPPPQNRAVPGIRNPETAPLATLTDETAPPMRAGLPVVGDPVVPGVYLPEVDGPVYGVGGKAVEAGQGAPESGAATTETTASPADEGATPTPTDPAAEQIRQLFGEDETTPPHQRPERIALSETETEQAKANNDPDYRPAEALRLVAQGKAEELNAGQLSEIGLERSPEGKLRARRLSPQMAETAPPPLAAMEGGEVVITAEGLAFLEGKFPRTRDLVAMDEAQARQYFRGKAEAQGQAAPANQGSEAAAPGQPTPAADPAPEPAAEESRPANEPTEPPSEEERRATRAEALADFLEETLGFPKRQAQKLAQRHVDEAGVVSDNWSIQLFEALLPDLERRGLVAKRRGSYERIASASEPETAPTADPAAAQAETETAPQRSEAERIAALRGFVESTFAALLDKTFPGLRAAGVTLHFTTFPADAQGGGYASYLIDGSRRVVMDLGRTLALFGNRPNARAELRWAIQHELWHAAGYEALVAELGSAKAANEHLEKVWLQYAARYPDMASAAEKAYGVFGGQALAGWELYRMVVELRESGAITEEVLLRISPQHSKFSKAIRQQFAERNGFPLLPALKKMLRAVSAWASRQPDPVGELKRLSDLAASIAADEAVLFPSGAREPIHGQVWENPSTRKRFTITKRDETGVWGIALGADKSTQPVRLGSNEQFAKRHRHVPKLKPAPRKSQGTVPFDRDREPVLAFLQEHPIRRFDHLGDYRIRMKLARRQVLTPKESLAWQNRAEYDGHLRAQNYEPWAQRFVAALYSDHTTERPDQRAQEAVRQNIPGMVEGSTSSDLWELAWQEMESFIARMDDARPAKGERKWDKREREVRQAAIDGGLGPAYTHQMLVDTEILPDWEKSAMEAIDEATGEPTGKTGRGVPLSKLLARTGADLARGDNLVVDGEELTVERIDDEGVRHLSNGYEPSRFYENVITVEPGQTIHVSKHADQNGAAVRDPAARRRNNPAAPAPGEAGRFEADQSEMFGDADPDAGLTAAQRRKAELDRMKLRAGQRRRLLADDLDDGQADLFGEAPPREEQGGQGMLFAPLPGDGFFSALRRAVETSLPDVLVPIHEPAVRGREFPARTVLGKDGKAIKEVPARKEPDKPAKTIGVYDQIERLAFANGVKEEEIKWSGLRQAVDRLARENGGKVTKDELLEYLENEGAVRFEEVVAGDKVNDEIVSKWWNDQYAASHPNLEWSFLNERQQDQARIDYAGITDQRENSTRFGQYQLPGGENYREMVLAMPTDRSPEAEARAMAKSDGMDFDSLDPEIQARLTTAAQDRVSRKRQKGEYTSSHFPDVPNYVAHMRLNERTDAEGKPGLFLEELQSDRHQRGREDGYQEAMSSETHEVRPAQIDSNGAMGWAIFRKGSDIAVSGVAETKEEAKEYLSEKPISSAGVPDAPHRKDWPLALFKRALRDAVASGKEWIGWTTGETQAERYDLSKRVSKLEYLPPDKGSPGVIRAYNLDGNNVIDRQAAPEELPDIVGKEMAERLTGSQPSHQTGSGRNVHALSGLELKVGGEGMLGFYDRILPKEIGKYVKQWGAKVEKGSLDKNRVQLEVLIDGNWVSRPQDTFANEAAAKEAGEFSKRKYRLVPATNNTTPIWRVTITPEMRRSVAEVGQSLFAPLPGDEDGGAAWRGELDRLRAEGRVRPDGTVLAPNGQGSILHQTLLDAVGDAGEALRRYAMVHTRAFKEWFGDSQVRDANGEPLVVWHGGTFSVADGDSKFDSWTHFGTRAAAEERVGGSGVVDGLTGSIEVEFLEDGPEGEGWYYTLDGIDDEVPYGTEEEARAAAEDEAMQMADNAEPPDASFTPAFLSGRFIDMPDLGTWGLWDVIRNLPDGAKPSRAQIERISDLSRSGRMEDDWNELTRILARKGIAGIRYRNQVEDKGSVSYIAFKGSSIKSATDNDGGFRRGSRSFLAAPAPGNQGFFDFGTSGSFGGDPNQQGFNFTSKASGPDGGDLIAWAEQAAASHEVPAQPSEPGPDETRKVHLRALAAIRDSLSPQGLAAVLPEGLAALRNVFAEGEAARGSVSNIIPELLKAPPKNWDIIGAKASSPEEWFMLNAAFRNPHYESLRVAIVDESGVVHSAEVLNIGSVDESIVDVPRILLAVEKAKAAGVANPGVLVSHNHPGGDPTPSSQDIRATMGLRTVLPLIGARFVDHVITNGTTGYSFDKSDTIYLTRSADVPWSHLERTEMPSLDDSSKTESLAETLRAVNAATDYVVYLNTRLRIVAVEQVPLDDNAAAAIIQGAARHGAKRAVLLSRRAKKPSTGNHFSALRAELNKHGYGVAILDVISMPETSSYVASGLMEEGGDYGLAAPAPGNQGFFDFGTSGSFGGDPNQLGLDFGGGSGDTAPRPGARPNPNRPPDNDRGSDPNLEPAGAGRPGDRGGQGGLRPGGRADRPDGGSLVEGGDGGGAAGGGRLDAGDLLAALGGELFDPGSYGAASEPAAGPAGGSRPGGRARPDGGRPAPESRGEGEPAVGLVQPGAAPGALAAGGAAGPLGGILRTAPALKAEQAGDVAFVERRFDAAQGALLTNGTGTGKTFSGLGVVARFLERGAKAILVAVPNDKIASDWIKTARAYFGIADARQLANTRDSGEGARLVATTYANLGQNLALGSRQWDLIVTDEAHKLSEGKEGRATLGLHAVRALTQHPAGAIRAAELLHPEAARILAQVAKIPVRQRTDEQSAAAEAAGQRIYDTARELRERARETAPTEKPRVLMLSATPFAYHFSLDYGEGYLYDLPDTGNKTGYNQPGPRDAFYVENLGYRMRTGKLTQPENATAVGILERRLAERLMREGAMSGRALDVDQDYQRQFVLMESRLGEDLDGIFAALSDPDNDLRPLSEDVGLGEYLARRYLFEGLKAEMAVDRIEQHLDLGRKVVVFHDFKKGGSMNPLPRQLSGEYEVYQNGRHVRVPKQEMLDRLKRLVPRYDELSADLDGLRAPIDLFQDEFSERVGIYNGSVSAKVRRELADRFNDPRSGLDILLVQRASGKEGVSLHDTTGERPRALIDIGFPSRPTDAIQVEGRIYRLGVKTPAIFEYLTTGTTLERMTFAQTIAQRASTAENLAMGEKARSLLQSFADGYLDAAPGDPSPEQGKGGKERDAARNNANPFKDAIALYFTNQKKTSRTRSAEGTDYFATPEPLGFKMVEWAGIREGEKVLEPSAGHGAIARFFPDATNRHAIEPSRELASRLALNATDTVVHTLRFEDYNVVNKFDAIVLNPPFGTAGKTAMEHLAKAARHLRNGGRIVALIPAGSSMDRRYEQWMDSDEAKGLYQVAEYAVPGVAFARAGTTVATRVVVIDKTDTPDGVAPGRSPREFGGGTVEEFFAEIEHATAPDRAAVLVPEARDAMGETEAEAQAAPSAAAAFMAGGRGAVLPAANPAQGSAPGGGPAKFSAAEGWHAKKNVPTYVAKIDVRLDRDDYKAALDKAKSLGGYYSAFKGPGAIPGFQFPNAERRDAFLAEMGGGKMLGAPAPGNQGFFDFGTSGSFGGDPNQQGFDFGEPPAPSARPKPQRLTSEEARDLGYTERDPSDIRTFQSQSVTKDSLTKHLQKHGFRDGDTIQTPKGDVEIYVSSIGFAYSWRPKQGLPRDGVITDPEGGVRVYPSKMRDPNAKGVSAEVDNVTLPEGYTRDGDFYVSSTAAARLAAGEAERARAERVARPPADPRDRVYQSLFNRGVPAGPNMVALTDSQITPAIRKRLRSERDVERGLPGRPQETPSFSLRRKSEVSGVSTDLGWILKDKRPDFAARSQPPENTNGMLFAPAPGRIGSRITAEEFDHFRQWAVEDNLHLDENFKPEDVSRVWVAADVDGNIAGVFASRAEADDYFRTMASRGEFLWDVTESYERMVGGIPARVPDGPILEDAARIKQLRKKEAVDPLVDPSTKPRLTFYPVDPAPGETPAEAGNLPRVTPTGRAVTRDSVARNATRYGTYAGTPPQRRTPDPNRPHREGNAVFAPAPGQPGGRGGFDRSSLPPMPKPLENSPMGRALKRMPLKERVAKSKVDRDGTLAEWQRIMDEEIAREEANERELAAWLGKIPENQPISIPVGQGEEIFYSGYNTVTKSVGDPKMPWRTTSWRRYPRPEWTEEEEAEYDRLFEWTRRGNTTHPDYERNWTRLNELGSMEALPGKWRWIPTGHQETPTRLEALREALEGHRARKENPKIGALFAPAPAPGAGPARAPGETVFDSAANRLRRAAMETPTVKALKAKLAEGYAAPFAEPLRRAVDFLLKQAVPLQRLDMETNAMMREMAIKQAFAHEEGMDVLRALSGKAKFTDLAWPARYAKDKGMRARLFLAMEGKMPMDTLPPEVQALGKRLRRLLDKAGMEAVRTGRLHPDTFEGRRDTWMPYYFFDHEKAAAGNLFARLRVGLRDVRAQRTTMWRIEDMDVADPKDGEQGALVAWDDRGRKVRFRSEQHRDAFYEEFLRERAAETIRSRAASQKFDEATNRQAREITAAQLNRPDKLTPELRGYARRVEQELRARYRKGDPLTQEELEKAGLILDPVYAVAKHAAQAGHDNATAEFLTGLANRPGIVGGPNLAGFAEIPNHRRFGALAGQWVREDVAEEVANLVNAPSDLARLYDGLMTLWKTGKTVYNLGTHVRNVLGNFLFAQFAGINPADPRNARHYRDGLRAIFRGGEALEEMFEQGVLGGDFLTAELRKDLSRLLPDSAIETPDIWTQIGMRVEQGARRLGLLDARKVIEGAYRLEDEAFKAAAYLKAKAGGMDPAAAAAHVRKWFPYYDQIGTSSAIRAARRTAMPFFSFRREAIRILGHAAAERPVSLGLALAAPVALSALSAALLGLDDEDYEEIRKTAMRGKGRFFARDFPLFSVLLPARDSEGRLQQWDLSNVVPFGDLLGRRIDIDDGTPAWQQWALELISGSPLTGIPLEMAFNTDTFSGRPIWEANMTGGEQAAAAASHVWQELVPPLAPGGSGWNMVAEAGTRRTNRSLEVRNRAQSMLRALAGIDARNASPNLYALAEQFRADREIPRDPIAGYGTTPESRARARVFAYLVADEPDVEGIARELSFLRRQGRPLETEQDFNRLLWYRNPIMVIDGADNQRRFRQSLSREGAAVLADAEAEFARIRRSAGPVLREANSLSRTLPSPAR